MEKTNDFIINLKGMREDRCFHTYLLNDSFFDENDFGNIRGGNITAKVRVLRKMQSFELSFKCEGTAIVPCDRCLDNITVSIDASEDIVVKLGSNYAEEGDLITIPEEDGTLDVAWLLKELVELSIPLQHVHDEGKCNEEMLRMLNQHSVSESDKTDEERTETIGGNDPRWDELKKLLNNK